jgi:glutamate synthase (NADPH/NADH) small chain
MLGHAVTVFESRSKAGGLNEYGIAAYKMVDERAAREVAFILSIGGITLQTGKALGTDFSLASLRQDYDAVFLGLGHNACNALQLENEDVDGLHNAVDYISRIRQENLSDLPVGRNVVVIGGGNTAIDIAVQCRQLGAETVTLVYRRGLDEMSATGYEQEVAQTHGVLIRTWACPSKIEADEQGIKSVRFERTVLDEQQGLALTGEYFDIPADQVFKAIGQHFDKELPLAGTQPADDCPEIKKGRIMVDSDRRTSLPNVWAGGDCIAGQDLTVAAVQDGKMAAISIHQYLGSA